MSAAPSYITNFIPPVTSANRADPDALKAIVAANVRTPQEAMRLEALLRSVDDLSHLSPELLTQAMVQGCWYHVNPFRSTLIRSLEIPLSSRILEVGCGGGALTRYLGEQGYQVVALETSEELAECARLRCRDLPNVEVITGFVESVLADSRFDFVVCVDPLFVESEYFEPGLELMTLCKKALKSTGTLILSISNPLHAPGTAHIEPSQDHVRGKGATLGAAKSSLASAGFCYSEEYLTFPNHASPRFLLDPKQTRAERVNWIPLITDLYSSSEVAEAEMLGWWRSIYNEGLESNLAPGWLILAHSHAVHSVLWKGGAGKLFTPTISGESVEAKKESDSSPKNESASEKIKSVEVKPIHLATSDLVTAVLGALRPSVHAVRDYKESLISADRRIDELAQSEEAARQSLEDSREALVKLEEKHTSELSHEQDSRRIREAELGLVLKQYHAVGAMCHDMREEGRKLRDMLDELKRRYVASEEWGSSLAKRAAEAEEELERTRASWTFRIAKRVQDFLRG